MDQNLSQHRTLYEVAKTGNISKAAKELYISQPAISKSTSKLENSLGTTLLDRNSRGVQLTEEGQILFSHIPVASDALSQGEQELKRIKNFHMGHISIGVSNTLCRFIMVSYLKGYIEKYSRMKITIESQSSTHTPTMLDKERIDIDLVAEPKYQKNPVFLPVVEIEDIFVAAPSYLENLRLRGGEHADVFRDGNIVLLDRNNVTRHYIDDYMNANHMEANSLLEVTTMDLLIEFARIGLGAICVIGELVKEGLEAGRLVQLQLDTPINKKMIGFVCHPNRPSKALDTFIDFIRHTTV